MHDNGYHQQLCPRAGGLCAFNARQVVVPVNEFVHGDMTPPAVRPPSLLGAAAREGMMGKTHDMHVSAGYRRVP